VEEEGRKKERGGECGGGRGGVQVASALKEGGISNHNGRMSDAAVEQKAPSHLCACIANIMCVK